MDPLPDHDTCKEGMNRVRSVAAEESFRFSCHPGVSCFTECCRELDLALSPYDVVRLRQALGLTPQAFLDRYAIIEFGPDDLMPQVYLAMVDDGRASCPFVDASGCKVYQDRPAACRTYPLGRGVSNDSQGVCQEQFILITEEHCQGFNEEREQSVTAWQKNQELAGYNRINDLILPLIPKNEDTQTFRRLSDEEASLFIDTLYRLDLFRGQHLEHDPTHSIAPDDDRALLITAIDWLKQQWQSAR
jgi:Fe-S-cluster containining protein